MGHLIDGDKPVVNVLKIEFFEPLGSSGRRYGTHLSAVVCVDHVDVNSKLCNAQQLE